MNVLSITYYRYKGLWLEKYNHIKNRTQSDMINK